VPAGSHGDEKFALARETDGGPDVDGAGAARDEPGMTIDRTVPDRASGVVLRVAGTDELSTEVLREVGDGHRAPPGDRQDGPGWPGGKLQRMELRPPRPFTTLEAR
jgi:hypothetical protein